MRFRAVALIVGILALSVNADLSRAEQADRMPTTNVHWQITARELPPPLAASSELYEQIAHSPQPKIRSDSTQNGIDEAQWQELVAIRQEASNALDLDKLEFTFNVSITRMNVEGVNVFQVKPKRVRSELSRARLLYLHGGAYVFNAGKRGAYEAIVIASYTGVTVWSVDYRTALQAPHPAALQDALTVYKILASSKDVNAIALGGTSAGGGLTLALMQKIRDLDLAQPKALYAGSPWADLTKTSDTLYSLEGIDRILVSYDVLLKDAAKLYAGTEILTAPPVSPLYGPFDQFPPTYLVSGTRDLLLSDTARVHRAIKKAGGQAELNVYEGLSHAEYLANLNTDESQQVYLELAAFLKPLLSD